MGSCVLVTVDWLTLHSLTAESLDGKFVRTDQSQLPNLTYN
jgi:hypothetical protein